MPPHSRHQAGLLNHKGAKRLHVGERIRALRTRKRVRQDVLARMVGISPGGLTNFEKGRRRVSLDWLEKIAAALDAPVAYFLAEGRSGKKIAAGDPRKKQLLDAWRLLKHKPTLRRGFLRIMKGLGRSAGVKSRRR